MAGIQDKQTENLEVILSNAGLPMLLEKFVSEKIDSTIIETMTDTEMANLGITTIGDRIRLRESAKQQKISNSDSRQISTMFPGFRSLCRQNGNKQISKKMGEKSWTGQFYCFSSVYQDRVPTCSDKEILYKAGLGLKKVKLNCNFGEEEVMNVLQGDEGFPKLSSGGFELLRTEQNCRKLVTIPGPWTSNCLRTSVGSQARIYLRPIQHSLSTEPTTQVTQPSMKMACEKCNIPYPIQELRNHIQQCGSSLVLSETDIGLPDISTYFLSDRQSEVQSSSQVYVISMASENQELPALNSENVENLLQDSRQETQVIQEISDVHSHEALQQDLGQHNLAGFIPGDMSAIVNTCITFCRQNDINNPVEILKKTQGEIVTGRPLELEDPDTTVEGETNFITVDRNNLLDTSMEEISFISDEDLRKTLEVQFYNEQAADYGGPRKEFFRLVLVEIKEKYFDNGLRELLAPDYRTLFVGLPELKFLLQPSAVSLTMKRLLTMLKPTFSDEGSNAIAHEKEVYGCFVKYLREVGAGRRKSITLTSVLCFVTSTDEEPLLGFKIQPSIQFHEVQDSYIPTASTCVNCLKLPRASQNNRLPKAKDLFELYDYAFVNTFYGLQ